LSTPPDIQTLIAQARRGEHGAVHVLVGEEAFLVNRAVQALRRAAVGQGIAGLNEDLFHGTSPGAGTVVAAARTLAMMSPTRFVMLRGIDKMVTAELEILAEYLEDPAPSSCLVITAEKLDGRTKFAKVAKKKNYWVDIPPMKPPALSGFAQAEARVRGHTLAPDATQHLLDALGDDLAAIDDAIERLSLFVGKGAPIDVAAIDACVARLRIETIWMLVDAIGLRDARKAIHALASLLEDKEPALRIVAMVARQMRMIAKMRTALDSGMRPEEAAVAAGAPPWKSRELSDAARRASPASLARTFATLATLERALKSSKLSSETLMVDAVSSLCGA
jgi:DNA polymerase-3 subunit delta